jgi:ribosomal protein S4
VKTRRGVSVVRALSKLGLASRTDARTLVAEGRVRINGAMVTDPSALVA